MTPPAPLIVQKPRVAPGASALEHVQGNNEKLGGAKILHFHFL
jgi:hypothetical protein